MFHCIFHCFSSNILGWGQSHCITCEPGIVKHGGICLQGQVYIRPPKYDDFAIKTCKNDNIWYIISSKLDKCQNIVGMSKMKYMYTRKGAGLREGASSLTFYKS